MTSCNIRSAPSTQLRVSCSVSQPVRIGDEESSRPGSPVAGCTPVSPQRREHEGGYLLLAVLLMMAFMIIAASIEAPQMVQQMKRDREEEMIHRGTEYARAIKKYYKKFGRYPATLEQLDNTNQIRFLRKRYKDPLTKDGKWKILNYGDIQTVLNASTPGTPAAALAAQGQSSFGPSAATSVSTTGFGSGQSALSPANVGSTSSTGFDSSSTFASQQQTGVTGNTLRAFPETRHRAMLNSKTVPSLTPSAWDRIRVSREARLATSSLSAQLLATRLLARLLAAEPSSELPASTKTRPFAFTTRKKPTTSGCSSTTR